MNGFNVVEAIFSVVIILSTTLAGVAWRRVDRTEERVRDIELLLAGKARFVTEEVLDRKLKPLNEKLGKVLRWIEAQSGTVSAISHSDDD